MRHVSTSDPFIMGVLLAAGRGRRMGTTKQLLPWPHNTDAEQLSSTVIESAFDAIASQCRRMIVVLGHEAEAVTAALEGREFVPVHADPDAEMFESIKVGLRRAIIEDTMTSVLLHPADHPEVRPSTVMTLLEENRSHPQCVIIPEYRGRGGHPVLIPRSFVEDILAFTGSGGLRAFWTLHPAKCLRVSIDDPQTVLDLDTPEAYEAHRD
ncbi:MAG: nucleotidyltransferase family protein [Planctomycetes bacterium]|nr:nucleotidyltransferase family protein [Planctomycetota bacterium]MCH7603008.1 nucleotidyltransferase family protein [Planctomycetota bacterium]